MERYEIGDKMSKFNRLQKIVIGIILAFVALGVLLKSMSGTLSRPRPVCPEWFRAASARKEACADRSSGNDRKRLAARFGKFVEREGRK